MSNPGITPAQEATIIALTRLYGDLCAHLSAAVAVADRVDILLASLAPKPAEPELPFEETNG